MDDSAAYDRLIDALRAAGKTVRHDSDTKAMAQCPAHPDRNPSLRLTAVPGKVLVYCHAGCDTENPCAARAEPHMGRLIRYP